MGSTTASGLDYGSDLSEYIFALVFGPDSLLIPLFDLPKPFEGQFDVVAATRPHTCIEPEELKRLAEVLETDPEDLSPESFQFLFDPNRDLSSAALCDTVHALDVSEGEVRRRGRLSYRADNGARPEFPWTYLDDVEEYTPHSLEDGRPADAAHWRESGCCSSRRGEKALRDVFDNNCADPEVCGIGTPAPFFNGQCCHADGDCIKGERCDVGICIKGCTTGDHCPTDFFCDLDVGECISSEDAFVRAGNFTIDSFFDIDYSSESLHEPGTCNENQIWSLVPGCVHSVRLRN